MTQIPDWLHLVGPGWHPLLTQVHEDIAVVDPNYAVAQVKEKFGGLRLYLLNRDPEIDVLVRAAEATSESTCENCGQAGYVRQRPGSTWLTALCDVCAVLPPTDSLT